MNISFPSYRRQKDKRGDRAFVVINTRRFYLGLYNSAESQQQYTRLMAEWLAGNGDLPPESDELTIAQFINRFWKHAKVYYCQSDGNLSSEAHNYRAVLRILRELYGDQFVDEFKPASLKACRQRMINMGWSRRGINRAVVRLRSVFKWGVTEGLVSAPIHSALTALDRRSIVNTLPPQTTLPV